MHTSNTRRQEFYPPLAILPRDLKHCHRSTEMSSFSKRGLLSFEGKCAPEGRKKLSEHSVRSNFGSSFQDVSFAALQSLDLC